jgi:hypothetical protein
MRLLHAIVAFFRRTPDALDMHTERRQMMCKIWGPQWQ